ncbi:MAG: hypothetical protein P4L43_06380 [Syntrophobacteraceae bacterium]|nr:hypothetical protein [Syntrophobacteraceae bacterium]
MRILPDIPKHGRFGIIFICVFSAALSGCGRKTFPQPKGSPPPARVNDLESRVEPRAVEISWSPLPAAAARRVRYSILKSDISWQKRNCLECPPTSQLQVQSMDAAAVKPGPDGRLRWRDPDVAFHRAYRYQIALIDSRGATLSLSNPVIAKVYPGPVAPVGLTVATQSRGVLIEWKQAPKDIAGKRIEPTTLSFRVQRLTGSDAWKDASPLVRGEAYYDQEVAPAKSSTYRVVPARDIDGENVYGEPSSRISAMGPQSAPPPPPGKVWTIPARGGLEVHWIEGEVKTAGFYVYRKQGKEIVRLTASPVLHPPFIDRGGLSQGETYFYAVSAVSTRPNHEEGLLSKWVKVRNLLTH